jgi:hypothetical protein
MTIAEDSTLFHKQPVRLVISEPWEAHESIMGRILRTIQDEASGKKHLLLETLMPKRHYLVAERYRGDDVTQIAHIGHMVVTVARLTDEAVL